MPSGIKYNAEKSIDKKENDDLNQLIPEIMKQSRCGKVYTPPESSKAHGGSTIAIVTAIVVVIILLVTIPSRIIEAQNEKRIRENTLSTYIDDERVTETFSSFYYSYIEVLNNDDISHLAYCTDTVVVYVRDILDANDGNNSYSIMSIQVDARSIREIDDNGTRMFRADFCCWISVTDIDTGMSWSTREGMFAEIRYHEDNDVWYVNSINILPDNYIFRDILITI